MKKSKIYFIIAIITYLLLMIVKRFVNIPDLIYICLMVFAIVVLITAIREQKKEK